MKRPIYLHEIDRQLKVHPICGLLGPRQVGKTTLAKMYQSERFAKNALFFDLENPIDLSRFDNPMLVLESFTNGLIIIDEIQRRPELFPVLRVLADQKEKNRKFLILGSASKELIRQSSESLAGRIGYIELPPFSLEEVGEAEKLWLRGGFPLAFLAPNEEESYTWRQSYVTTYLERDIPALGFQIHPQQIRRFWLMLAHYHGQIFNASELSRSLGISDHTVRRYLDILVGTFMIRQLSPWHENLQKRQIKSPKIYFRDSGILHALLGLKNNDQLHTYPKLGAFWEGFAIEQIIREFRATSEECYFWGTQGGAELDLFIFKDGKRLGFECKYADAPKLSPSMKIALKDLKLDQLYVVYPGTVSYQMSDQILAIGLKNLSM